MLTINFVYIFYTTDNRTLKKQIPVLLTVCTELSTGLTFRAVTLSPLSTSLIFSNHKIGLFASTIPGMAIDRYKPCSIKNVTKKRVYLFLSE